MIDGHEDFVAWTTPFQRASAALKAAGDTLEDRQYNLAVTHLMQAQLLIAQTVQFLTSRKK